MNELIDRYLNHLETHPTQRGHEPSSATIRGTRADLQGFIRWWEHARRQTFDIALVLEGDLFDWQEYRQVHDGAKISTINRASASLRGMFAWAKSENLIARNPAERLHDLPPEDVAPRSTPPEAVEWIFRIASNQRDPIGRHRDLAWLTLLNDCGLRSQEADDLQIRDVDLAGGCITVRAGVGRKARRVPIKGASIRRLKNYLTVRCPNGLPPVGSDAERELFLIGRRVDKPGQPWEPGMSTAAQRKRLAELRQEAIEKILKQASREPSLAKVEELHDLARQLNEASPHRLRHGLAYRLLESGATPAYLKDILGHSRVSTSLMYSKPTEEAKRTASHEPTAIEGAISSRKVQTDDKGHIRL